MEWAPLDLMTPITYMTGFKIFFALFILIIPYLFKKQFKNINWAEILILGVTLYMSFKHQRHIIFFGIAAASYMYYVIYPAFHWYTNGILEKFYGFFSPKIRATGKILRSSLVYALILFIGLGVNIVVPMDVKVDSKRFPIKAVKFIKDNQIKGNLLVLFNWGSYALYKLYPQCRVAVDGRYEEVYPKSLIDDVARFHYFGKNWEGLLYKYHADAMLIPVEYRELYQGLKTLPDWKLIYLDEMAAVFVRVENAKKKWIMPDKNFNPDKEKFKSDIHSAFK